MNTDCAPSRGDGASSTSTPAGSKASSQSHALSYSGAFVDAVAGRHASTSASELLARRRLTWDQKYGWTYDAWIDDPARFAQAGANGRFSLPALARGFSAGVAEAMQKLAGRATQ